MKATLRAPATLADPPEFSDLAAIRRAIAAIQVRLEALEQRERASDAAIETGSRRLGFARLSLPGYSTDGHAIVYGFYFCGALCGYGWLFVLEKNGGEWRVKSATVTVIS